MAVTLTEQWRVWPRGGAEIEYLTDGEGMHSLVPYDLVRQLNNLGSYCNPFVQYTMPPPIADTDVTGFVQPGELAYETFVGQMPVVVPAGAVRMKWTLGLKVDVTGGPISVNYVSVYLSRAPYTGTAGVAIVASGFDPATTQSTASQVTSTTAYRLYESVGDGISPIDRITSPISSNTGQAQMAYAIIAVGFTAAAGGGWYTKDFTVWFQYE